MIFDQIGRNFHGLLPYQMMKLYAHNYFFRECYIQLGSEHFSYDRTYKFTKNNLHVVPFTMFLFTI